MLVIISPFSAHADGLGGLAGLQAAAAILLGLFVVLWVIIWLVLRHLAKKRKKSEGGRYWLTNSDMPLGLRVLALLQYTLGFFYALMGFSGLFSHGRGINIAFGVLFATLAIISANGYIKRSLQWGFKLGMVLGSLCIVNAVLTLIWFGLHHVELFSPGFGMILLALLYWKYRPYFSAE